MLKQFEVVEGVVMLVLISVVDMIPIGNWPILVGPNAPVQALTIALKVFATKVVAAATIFLACRGDDLDLHLLLSLMRSDTAS